VKAGNLAAVAAAKSMVAVYAAADGDDADSAADSAAAFSSAENMPQMVTEYVTWTAAAVVGRATPTCLENATPYGRTQDESPECAVPVVAAVVSKVQSPYHHHHDHVHGEAAVAAKDMRHHLTLVLVLALVQDDSHMDRPPGP
jgi:hypothetical protein